MLYSAGPREAKSIGVHVVKPFENVIYNSVQKYRVKMSNKGRGCQSSTLKSSTQAGSLNS
jgi:hypothetical protein